MWYTSFKFHSKGEIFLIGRSGNPTLRERTFERPESYQAGSTMTLGGTVNKSFITLIILLASAFATWMRYFEGYEVVQLAYIGGIAAFVVALIVSFAPKASPFLVPVYAVLEGMFLGAISATYESLFDGIVMKAALLTACVFLALLLVYKFQIIKATENFKLGVFAATGGIALVYLASMVLRWFNIEMPYLHEGNPIGIGISVVIVIVAALNLVLDFDFIEKGAENGSPKYMEWYGAFGLMVTLVWLYLELLRLLAKINSRD